jgi:phage RecT family recombinase
MSNNSTAVATVTPFDRIRNTLRGEQMQLSLAPRLAAHRVSLDAFTEVAITAISQNPDLIDCDRNSLYNAVASCAKDGLLPDGKQAAIVAFNTRVKFRDENGRWQETWVKKAQHMPMVEGIIHTFGKYGVKAYAVSVYENDEYDTWNDEHGQHVKHKPVKLGKPRGERVGALAVARDSDGQVWVEAMDQNDLEAPRRATKQKDQQGNLIGPWRDTPDRMEQKSALHRLAKRVPKVSLADDAEFQEEPAPIAPITNGAGLPAGAADSSVVSNQAAEKPARKPRSAALQAVVDAGGAESAPSAEPTEKQPEQEPAKPAEPPKAAEPAKPAAAAQPEKKPEPAKPAVQPQGKEVF